MSGRETYSRLSCSYYSWINVSETTPQGHEEIFAHADDVAVVVDNIDELQDVARRWHARMDGNSMKINTVVMQMSRWKQEYNVSVGRDKIYQADSYKYLGVENDAGNNQVTEINARIGKYSISFLMMYPITERKDNTSRSKCKSL